MCDPYAEGWAYHRNVMSKQNSIDGHDVTILTTKYTMDKDGYPQKVEEDSYINDFGVKIIRLDDKFKLPQYLQIKIRASKGIYKNLKEISPDAIMVHNIAFSSLGEVIQYKQEYPDTRLYGDTHADKWNSATNFISKYFLNRVFYKHFIKKYINYFDRFFYISLETKEFLETEFKLDTSKFELDPLCCEVISKEKKREYRVEIEKELNLSSDTILFVHSGKLNRGKKTRELLEAFYNEKSANTKLIILGSIPSSEKKELDFLIKRDQRVEYLGWKKEDDLKRYLAAADLYLQPGTQSITMMNALACGTPVMVYPHRSYDIYCNGCEFQVQTFEEIQKVIKLVLESPQILDDKSNAAFDIAKRWIDSKELSRYVFGGKYDEK